MSDTQRDREERQHVIEVLKNMLDWMGAIDYIVATPERIHALGYAIASIETDLRYDLLYEETSGQADKQADKPTTKNNLGVDLISREQAKTAIRDKFKDLPSRVEINTILNELPAVTPQKIGHWIEHDWKEFLGEGYYRCSVCNCGYQRYTKGIRKSDIPYINGKEYTLWNIDHYCPNCGARMIEPQESEE